MTDLILFIGFFVLILVLAHIEKALWALVKEVRDFTRPKHLR